MGSFYAQPRIADTLQVQADMEEEYGVTLSWRIERYATSRSVYVTLYAHDILENRDMGVMVRESISYASFDKKLAGIMLGMLNRLSIDWERPSWTQPLRARNRAARGEPGGLRGSLPDSLPDSRRRNP